MRETKYRAAIFAVFDREAAAISSFDQPPGARAGMSRDRSRRILGGGAPFSRSYPPKGGIPLFSCRPVPGSRGAFLALGWPPALRGGGGGRSRGGLLLLNLPPAPRGPPPGPLGLRPRLLASQFAK